MGEGKMTQDKDNALLPCPFCGSNDVDPEGWASLTRKGPACQVCDGSCDTVERWNTRANVPQPEAVDVDKMLVAINKCENTHQLAGFLSTMNFTESDPHTALAFLEASRNLLSAPVVPDGWQPIETAPLTGQYVIVAWPSQREGVSYEVGEAYFNPERDEWWLAGTTYGDYPAAPMNELGMTPEYWRPLPAAPDKRAEGGG